VTYGEKWCFKIQDKDIRLQIQNFLTIDFKNMIYIAISTRWDLFILEDHIF
jgi:hypothetical protein